MSIRKRIWALPAVSAVIFIASVGFISILTSTAHQSIESTGSINYPALQQGGHIADEIQGITGDFKNAVTEGDVAVLEQIALRSSALSQKISDFGKLPGKEVAATRLASELSAYIAPANNAARAMLGEPGDVQKLVAEMQSALKTLQSDIDKQNADAAATFASGISSSMHDVKLIQKTSIACAILVLLTLAIAAHFIIRSIWLQLGGEP